MGHKIWTIGATVSKGEYWKPYFEIGRHVHIQAVFSSWNKSAWLFGFMYIVHVPRDYPPRCVLELGVGFYGFWMSNFTIFSFVLDVVI